MQMREILERAETAEGREAIKLERILKDREFDMPVWLRAAQVLSAQVINSARSDPNFSLGSTQRYRAVVIDRQERKMRVELEVSGNVDGAEVEVVSAERAK